MPAVRLGGSAGAGVQCRPPEHLGTGSDSLRPPRLLVLFSFPWCYGKSSPLQLPILPASRSWQLPCPALALAAPALSSACLPGCAWLLTRPPCSACLRVQLSLRRRGGCTGEAGAPTWVACNLAEGGLQRLTSGALRQPLQGAGPRLLGGDAGCQLHQHRGRPAVPAAVLLAAARGEPVREAARTTASDAPPMRTGHWEAPRYMDAALPAFDSVCNCPPARLPARRYCLHSPGCPTADSDTALTMCIAPGGKNCTYESKARNSGATGME